MSHILPTDLFQAEKLLYTSITRSLIDSKTNRIAANLLFPNIRLNPILKRLCTELFNKFDSLILLWPDEGGAALAKRDMPEFSHNIYSFNKFLKADLDNISLVLSVAPNHYDFDQFKSICGTYHGTVLMLNGKLEDIAIGIGNVGRERRKTFIRSWSYIYWLQPLTNGAIMKLYDTKWILFRLDQDGYRYSDSFDIKPDEDMITESLLNS